MNQRELHEISSRHRVNEHKSKKALMAFVSAGMLAVIGQLFNDWLLNYFSKENAGILTILFFIFMATLLTGMGIYDRLARYAGAGLFIPITGFSNSLSSSALECKREGLLYGIGSNMFKLAGSVITYGIVSAIVFSFITYWVKML